MVGTVLLNCLRREAHASPDAVDSILRELAQTQALADKSIQPQDLVEEANQLSTVDRVEDERSNRKVDITTFLALTHETPFALSTLKKWANAPAESEELLRAIPATRAYLVPNADSRVRQRSFKFVTTASTSALDHLADLNALLAGDVEPTADQLSELKRCLRVLDTTADQIYFASGAFDRKRGNADADIQQRAATPEEIALFAELAIPTLLICAGSKAAPVIHHVVETLVFLARVDEKRSLIALAEAVTAHSNYSYESLASGVVIPYLTRLLAERRDLVLFDEQGVTAFRTLLSAFAGAGDEDALALAYTFADVFR